jgi:hypothetical protein
MSGRKRAYYMEIYCYQGSRLLNNLKYVHQLQNLFFALTGEELTISTPCIMILFLRILIIAICLFGSVISILTFVLSRGNINKVASFAALVVFLVESIRQIKAIRERTYE